MLGELRFHPIVQRFHERFAVLLMKQQAVLRRQFGGACFRIIFIYVAQCFENVTAGIGETRRDFHKLPSSMREAVGQQDLDAFGKCGGVARQCVAHLHGRGQCFGTMRQHIAQIFAGVLAAGEVHRDLASFLCGHDAAGEHAGAIIRGFARHREYAHSGVVVVQHFALRGLPDQLVARGFDDFRLFFHDLPLRRSGQRDAQ